MGVSESGYIHPLVHVNRSSPDPSIPPCYDCGAQVDDYYTEPNRCGPCHAKHVKCGGAPLEPSGVPCDYHDFPHGEACPGAPVCSLGRPGSPPNPGADHA